MKKEFTAEHIAGKLREVRVLLDQGSTVVHSSPVRMQQKEMELQIVLCSSLISLVSRAGTEPATY